MRRIALRRTSPPRCVRRNHWVYCVILAVLLAACGSSEKSDTGKKQATLQPTLNAVVATPRPTFWPTADATGTASVSGITETPIVPTEAPTLDLSAAITLEGYALGPENASLTVVMYGDFQCELCARYARDLEVLRNRYPDRVRLIWRHLPDTRAYDKSALALQASEAAAAQNKFWEMHDQLFTHQSEWLAQTPDQFRVTLSQYAILVGLDLTRFDEEMYSKQYEPIITTAQQDAAILGIAAPPVLLFNGIPYTGSDDLNGFDEAAQLAFLEARFFDHAPDITIDPEKNYRATIVTEKGNIVIDLFPRDAVVAVNNFIFLAQNGWYDNITFHYVLPGFIAQTGDPSGTGRGMPGYTIPDENFNGLTFDRAGLVAMARTQGVANSAGSQFFITLAPLHPEEEWNGKYTIFGVVVEGMDVVQSLTPRNAYDPIRFPNPAPGDKVITITIEES